MTAALSPFDTYRPILLESLAKAVDSLSYGHAAPLHEAVSTLTEDASGDDVALLPGLLCLLAADALGASAEAALPAATALALLAAMGGVFGAIGAGALSERWGLPRTLNAGDGFYVLAQTTLANAPSASATTLDALDIFDAGGRAYSEELHGGGVGLSPALLSAAAALGALFAGADPSTVGALGEYGRSFAGGSSASLSDVSISDTARRRLSEAVADQARVG